MKILIVDCNIDADCWGGEDLRRQFRASGAELTVRRAPQGDLPPGPTGFDRIVVSGSRTSAMADAPWIEGLLGFIRGAVDANRPFLGVCFGQQMLARALGGKGCVRLSARSEYGWTLIRTLAPSPLLQGLAPEFYSFSSHQDEVGNLPRGMSPLAASDDCAIQACSVEGKPAYGIQFHPEKNQADAARSFARWKKKDPTRGKRYDAAIGEAIFGNFLKL